MPSRLTPQSLAPQSLTTVRGLLWRAPAAAVASLALALLLALGALGAAGIIGGGDATSPRAALLAAIVAVAGLAGATVVGLTWGVASVAVLTREGLAGRPMRLPSALRLTLRRLPALLGTAVLAGLALALSIFAWPLITVAALVRAAVAARALPAGARRPAARTLWLAVPLAGTLSALAAAPAALAAALAGQRPVRALRTGLSASWPARARALAGLAGLGLASWGLGAGALHVTDASAAAGTAHTLTRFAQATAAAGAVTAALIMLAGAGLGALAHHQNARPDPTHGTTGTDGTARAQRRRRALWRPARAAGVATLMAAALTVQLGSIALWATPASAPLSSSVSSSGFTVTTLADDLTPADGECVDPAVACGIREALAQAAAAVADGSSVTVSFAVSGTVTLAGTLRLGTGVTLDGAGQTVTLDAHHDFRAVTVTLAQPSEGGTARLARLTVTGGRSETPGAGLFSDAGRVSVNQVQFDDNVSGVAGGPEVNGGAVAVPYTDVKVSASTFTNNRALAGVGAAVATSSLTWTNSTSVNDTGMIGEPNGGAVYAQYGGTMTHATVIEGGGVAGGDYGQLGVTNSIIDTPDGGGAFPCMATTWAPDDSPPTGGNIDPTGTCNGIVGRADPYRALADNGGPTRTVALLPGSAALGAALPAFCTDADQRGEPRSADHCDIGAFQASAADLPLVTVTLTAPGNAGPASPFAVTAKLASDAAIPAGTVSFLDGTDTLVAGVAVNTFANEATTELTLTQGTHQLAATFVPDSGDATATSDPVPVSVQAGTTLTLAAPAPTRVHAPATVTATVHPGDTSAAGLTPTGTVSFSSGDLTADVTLVDGAATWTLPALPAGRVSAVYSGDENFTATSLSQDLTTANVATTVTGEPSATTVTYHDPLTVHATVTDTEGTVPGDVELLLDGATHSTLTLRDGEATFDLAGLARGEHTLTLRSHPEPGWSAADSDPILVSVLRAPSAITLDVPTSIVYGTRLDGTVTVTGIGSAGARLLDGDTVLDEIGDIGLPFTWHPFAYGLLPGTHTLTAVTDGSGTTAAATSAPVTVDVTRMPVPIVFATGAGMPLGYPSDVWATTVLSGDHGTFTVTDPAAGGAQLASGVADDAGSVTLSFPTSHAGSTTLTITYTPENSALYLPTSRPFTFNVGKGTAPEPSAMTWTADPLPGATELTVDYPVALSGQVTLHDTTYGDVGTATLHDGHAVVAFHGPAGTCYCFGRTTLSYSGDDNYSGSAGANVPFLFLPAYATTTALEPMPTTVPRGGSLYLAAGVNAPGSPWLATGNIVFAVNGVDQDPVALPVGGLARLIYTPAGPGQYTVTARFLPDTSSLTSSTSAPGVVTVSSAAMPQVTLTNTDGLTPKVGVPFTVTMRAEGISDQLAYLSPIALYDGTGVVASGVWTGTGNYATTTLTFTPAHAGALRLTGGFIYGPDTESGTSSTLSVNVAQATARLTLTSATADPQVGSPVWFHASLDASTGPAQSAPMDLQLMLDGHPVGPPVSLSAFGGYAVLYDVPEHYGTSTYSVVTTGDGADLGAGVAYAQVTPTRMPSFVRLDPSTVIENTSWTASPQLSGDLRWAPTGIVLVHLTGPSGTDVGGCSYTLPATSCQYRTNMYGTPEGEYTVAVSYLGDDRYAPASATSTLRITQLRSAVGLTMTPPVRDWVVGGTAHATWTTSVQGPDPDNGLVFIERDGIGLCQARAHSTGCSFTIPGRPGPLADQPDTLVKARYVPDGVQAPSETSAWGPPVPRCVAPPTTTWTSEDPGAYPYHAPTYTGPAGTECAVPGTTGFKEGTRLVVSFTAPPSYGIAHWEVDGQPLQVYRGDGQYQAWLANAKDQQITLTLQWAPECVELYFRTEVQAHVGGELDPHQPAWNGGRLDVRTPSNCAHPDRTSPYEDAQWAEGIGHYAKGTVVTMNPLPAARSNPTVDRLSYHTLDVPGALAPDATHYLYRYTATKDAVVYPRFRLSPALCSPISLHTGPGGTLALLGTERPALNSYIQEDRQGRCRTFDGTPGFLAGTTLHLSATPSNDGSTRPAPNSSQLFVSRWLGPAALDDAATRAATLLPTVQGAYPDRGAYRPSGRDVTVAQSKLFHYGVAFGYISCIPVDFDMSFPSLPNDPNNHPWLAFTDSNCPALSDTTRDEISGPRNENGGWDRGVPQVATQTRHLWYLPGTTVRAAASKATTSSPTGPRELSWTVTDHGTTTGTGKGTLEAVVTPGSALKFTGRFASTTCRTPNVDVRPARYGYQVEGAAGCPTGMSEIANQVILSANQVDGLHPVWSMYQADRHAPTEDNPQLTIDSNGRGVTSWDYFVYNDRSALFDRGYNVSLDYCAQIMPSVSLVDAHGAPISYWYDLDGNRHDGSVDARTVLNDGDDCPAPLLVLPGHRTQIGLSAAGAASYTALAWYQNGHQVTGLPEVSVDASGRVLNTVGVRLTPRCQTLTVSSHVFVKTNQNCPNSTGTNGNYTFLRNTPVELSFNGNEADTFHRWNGVDAQSGGHAVLIMHRDRHAEADYDSPGGFELAFRIISSLEQRAIAALVTAATGVAMGFMFIAQVAALTMVGISAGLRAAGVDGAVLDRLDQAATAVQSGLDAIQSVQDCTISWSTGGAGPALSLPTYQAGQGQSVATGVAGEVLDRGGYESVAEHLGTASEIYDTANLFVGGMGAYFADPAESWAAFADIGGCVKDSAMAAADAGAALGH